MKRSKSFFVLCAALFSSASFSVPLCQNTNSNIDSNGWGWENGSSCVAAGSAAASSVTVDCSSSVTDFDGDGWAWESGHSCRVSGGQVQTRNNASQPSLSGTSGAAAASAGIPTCGAGVADFDGDGWGFEDGQSCLVRSNTGSSNNAPVVQTQSVNQGVPQASGSPVCSGGVTDFDGDGWAFENGQSCLVSNTGSVNTASAGQSISVSSAAAGIPACSSGVTDFDGDGWAFENGMSCLVGDNRSPSSATQATQGASGTTPTGIRFNDSTLRRVGGTGDNFCQTWAADGSVVTALDDGEWFNGGYVYHSRLYKIFGDANNFQRSEVTNYPNFHVNGDGWFAYGMLSVKGVLYSLVTKTQGSAWSEGPFRGMKMLRSYDSGNTWHRVDRNNKDRFLDRWDIGREELTHEEMFFFEESGRVGQGKTAWPFAFASFVQSGQDHRASQDGFVYIYSPEGASTNQLLLARVPEDQVGNRSAWQYFSGWNGSTPTWNSNLEARQPNMVLPERNNAGEYFGFYSWLPSVVWNPGLQKYIMVNGGTYGGRSRSNSSNDYYNKWMHSRTGSLGFWYSDTAYGPWKQIYYTDYWTVDDANNLTYQPKLSPKWISEDGRTMTLIWSDAMLNANGNSHSVNYKWNQMEINIQTR